MAPRLLAGLVLGATLAGCAAPSIAECGLQVHAPARPIDEGVRFDVREVVGQPLALDGLGYTVTNRSDPARPVLFEGDLAALAGNGTRELRFLDDQDDRLLAVGDAFVVRAFGDLLLQLSRGSALVGSSLPCP